MNADEHSITMEEQEYAKMAEADDSMWWYRALHRNIHLLLRRFGPPAPADILDAGCGTGGLLKYLTGCEAKHRFQGLELYEPACAAARSRIPCPVTCGSVNEPPFPDASLDAAIITDVLSQKGVDLERAPAEIFRCLRPGGVLIVSEVALDWLQSYHDRRVGVHQRFERRQLTGILKGAGFEVTYSTYWNALLFPLVVLRRKVFSSKDSESDVKDYSKPAELFFGAVMAAERAWLRVGGRFPIGVSVMAVGVKPHED